MTPGMVTLGSPDRGDVTFWSFTKVFDSNRLRKTIPVPDDFVGWLTRYPYLETLGRRPARLGGIRGVALKLVGRSVVKGFPDCYGPCVPIAPPFPGAHPYVIGFNKKDPGTWRVFEVGGKNLVQSTYGIQEQAEELLRSVRFRR